MRDEQKARQTNDRLLVAKDQTFKLTA